MSIRKGRVDDAAAAAELGPAAHGVQAAGKPRAIGSATPWHASCKPPRQTPRHERGMPVAVEQGNRAATRGSSTDNADYVGVAVEGPW